jgi:anti-sigma regulatory factor (Ser/Thr protein kinase)
MKELRTCSGMPGESDGVAEEVWVPIASDRDIVAARQLGRRLAGQLGCSSSDQVLIATAISEIARNVVQYAAPGEVSFRVVTSGQRKGLAMTVRDAGPGIPDVARALEDGFSTSKGLGLGLGGARRLMDEFSLDSEIGRGTTITMIKWAP